MQLRRARLLRVALSLANLAAAVAALGAGVLLLLTHEQKAKPAPPRAVELPDALAEGPIPILLTFAEPDPRPPFARTTAYEDLMVILDAPQDFARSYRVVTACLDDEPASRSCIVEPRGSGQQIVLEPGERIGTLLLLGIDKEPGFPRSVRLRFRDLRRGADVTAVLAPDL
jgi:hypothetical protein